MRNLDFCRMIETENHPSVVHFVPASSLEKGAVVPTINYGEFTENTVASETFVFLHSCNRKNSSLREGAVELARLKEPA